VVSTTQLRTAAAWLCERYRISQRRAARLMGRARSTLRYQRRQRADEAPLIGQLRKLAERYPRWGYKRMHARLVKSGWKVNRKRVRRLWIQLGLRRPAPRRKPRKPGRMPGSSANSCVQQPARFKNDIWTYDFVADRTIAGGALKWLTLVDEYTRECLALHVDRSLTSTEVRQVLARVIGRRGAPTRIRSDNGSEFICKALTGWLPSKGTQPLPVAPGNPWQNGYIESFNNRFRDEFLERVEFESVLDARSQARWFRREFNTERPHSGLHYQTPQEFSDECDRGLHGQPLQQ
jgi:putative transposase